MNDPSTGLSELREATRDIHAAFESELKIAMPNAGRNEYRLFIEAMWGWLSPFEDALWRSEWPEHFDAHSRNGKRTWLLEDLRVAGLNDEEIARLPVAACDLDLDSQASRFGIVYVLEGSQLGSQVLLKRLSPLLAPWPTRWLRGYGVDVGRQWRSFIHSIDMHLSDSTSRRIAAQSARHTFASLQSWFSLRGAA